MTILEKFQQYFTIVEVVSAQVANRYRNQAWSFIDPALMEVMIWIREGIGRPIVINTTTQQQRGFRENTCKMVADKTAEGQMYCSAHCLGRAFDFDVKGMKAADVRVWIRQHINECPHPIRIERNTTWVHIDTCNIYNDSIYEFSE